MPRMHKSFVNIFVDYQNLKLLPKRKRKKYVATTMAKKRLMRFFDNYAKHVSAYETVGEYEKAVSQIDDRNNSEYVINQLKGSLGGYHYIKGVAWWLSPDYHDFAQDYEINQRIVNRVIKDGKISDLDWNHLRHAFSEYRGDSFSIPIHDSDDNNDYQVGEGLWVKLEKEGEQKRWHGLPLSGVAWAIFYTLEELLFGQIEVCLCHYCLQGVYLPTQKISRFCSVSCGNAFGRKSKKTG